MDEKTALTTLGRVVAILTVDPSPMTPGAVPFEDIADALDAAHEFRAATKIRDAFYIRKCEVCEQIRPLHIYQSPDGSDSELCLQCMAMRAKHDAAARRAAR